MKSSDHVVEEWKMDMSKMTRSQEAQLLGFDDNGKFFKKQASSQLSRMPERVRDAFENFIPNIRNKGDELVNA